MVDKFNFDAACDPITGEQLTHGSTGFFLLSSPVILSPSLTEGPDLRRTELIADS